MAFNNVLSGFLSYIPLRYWPAWLLVLATLPFTHPATLLPLLLATCFAMEASHSHGKYRKGDFETYLYRGGAWLVLITALTALTWLLLALPTLWIATTHSWWSASLLVLVAIIIWGLLWSLWPVFGLVFLLDLQDSEATGSRIYTALRRSLAATRRISPASHKPSHFIPSILALSLLPVAMLALSGTYAALPDEWRTMSLWVYALVILPGACSIIINRTSCIIEQPAPASTSTTKQPVKPTEPALKKAPIEANADKSWHELHEATTPPLLEAIRDGDTVQAFTLLEEGVEANPVPLDNDPDPRTALMLAALQPDPHLLRALIECKVDINHIHRGLSALLITARDGHPSNNQNLTLLLANGADPTWAGSDGNTPIHYAALNGNIDAVAQLVDAGADINAINQQPATALGLAYSREHWKVTQWLLENGAKTKIPEAAPPILTAAANPHDNPEGVKQLLARKANSNARSAHGRTALMEAASHGNLHIARYLLDHGAKVNLVDQHGINALMEAARYGSGLLCQALAEAGADPAARDRHHRDALILACQSTRATPETIQTLLDRGADKQAQDSQNQSALDHAGRYGRWDLVRVLDDTADLPADMADMPSVKITNHSPENLLDALRTKQWHKVDPFVPTLKTWAPGILARLYLELAKGDHPQARQWLLDNGLPPESKLMDGRSLKRALIDALPDSYPALTTLLDISSSSAGAGIVVQTMQHLVDTPRLGIPLVNRLLEAGADPFATLPDGRSCLHFATFPGWQPVLHTLLDKGLNPNIQCNHGKPPLYAALMQEKPDADNVRALIIAGADPECIFSNGETPLGTAMNLEKTELIRWLRWDGWRHPRCQLRPFHVSQAAKAGDLEAVEKLLALGFSVDSTDARGASALIYACGRGDNAMVDFLLKQHANKNLATPRGVTPLIAAINMHRLDLINRLLVQGVDAGQSIAGGVTALMIACAEGQADIATKLLEAGVSINRQDQSGRCALGIACQFAFSSADSLGCHRLLDTLIKAGSDINVADNTGYTPLLMLLGAHAKPDAICDATHLGALLPVLLDAGAEPNHANKHGITPLHACALHALLAPARILLTRKANRNAVDNHDRRPCDLAQQLGYMDVAIELDENHSIIPSVKQTLRTESSSPE